MDLQLWDISLAFALCTQRMVGEAVHSCYMLLALLFSLNLRQELCIVETSFYSALVHKKFYHLMEIPKHQHCTLVQGGHASLSSSNIGLSHSMNQWLMICFAASGSLPSVMPVASFWLGLEPTQKPIPPPVSRPAICKRIFLLSPLEKISYYIQHVHFP